MEQDMLNENPGNRNWKNKLEDVDGLSSVLLQDKNAAWDTLHHRLHQPTKKRKFIWYWLAAACLLALIIVPLFIFNNKNTPTGNTVVQAPASIKIKTPAVKEKAVAFAAEENNKKNIISEPAKIIHQKSPIEKLSKKELMPATSLLIEPVPSSSSVPVQIQPVQIPFTEKLTTLATPEKKKLKVVHVNELGTPLPELRSRTATDDYSVIQFNILNQRVYNNPPATTGSAVFGSSKSKNISN